MKKIIIITLLLFILTACTKVPQEKEITEFYPTYNDIDIKLNLMFYTLNANLGQYNDTHEEDSTYNGSIAKIYEYDTLEIETYQESGIEKVYAINFTSNEQTTREGLKIGDTKDKMISLYGINYTEPLENYYIYNISNTNLLISTENDIIMNIRYYLT